MGSGEVIAVVAADPKRRSAAVEALAERGFRAFGVAEIESIAVGERPILVALSVSSKAQFQSAVGYMRSVPHLVGLPVVAVGRAHGEIVPASGPESAGPKSSHSEKSGAEPLTSSEAFAGGAIDFVPNLSNLSDFVARVETRVTRQRHVRKIRRERDRTEALLDLTRALSSTLELREILYIVVRRIATVVETDRVSIVLGGVDEATAFVVAASDDEKLRDLPIELKKYPEIRRVLDTGQPLAVVNAQAHPLFELAQVDVPARFRSLVLMPIRFEDRTMGVLFLRFRQTTELSDDEEVFVSAIANATGIALRNASLLNSIRDQSDKNKDAHVEAERQLKALQRYVDFFDSCADGIVVVTLDGEILFCNPAACVILGRSEQELSHIRLEEMLTPDGRDSFRAVKASFNQAMFPTSVDLPIRTGHGRRRVLNVSFSSVLREHRGVILSIRDVTDDRATARELTKTKEFLQRVIDSSVDAIVSADLSGRVLLFNPAAERTYGYDAAEVVGEMSVENLYEPGEAHRVMRLIRSDEGGGPGVLQGYETELWGKEGRRVPVLLSAALIIHRGREIGSVGVFKDLRARLQMEERLLSAQRDLAEKEQKEFIAELAGATAHELNQPLTAVMGYAGMLEQDLSESPRLQRATHAIVREAERMAEIVRKIGKLTKFESKSYVGDTRIIDIEKSIDTDPPSSSTPPSAV